MLDIKNKTIEEINCDIKRLNSCAKYYYSLLLYEFEKTQPHATDYSKDKTQGGVAADCVALKYMMTKEEPQYKKMCKLYIDTVKEIELLEIFKKEQLEIIDEEEPRHKQVIVLFEQGKKQEEIAEFTKYSVRQVQRILKNFYNKRDIG